MTSERDSGKTLKTTSPKERKIGRYVQHLSELKRSMIELGLENDPPTETVKVIHGTQDEGRPLDALLPAYPTSECDTTEKGMKKILFNLQSLIGFKPPKK